MKFNLAQQSTLEKINLVMKRLNDIDIDEQ